MAIAPTGNIYKALSFNNTSSRNYGVYITGEAVYNAPERDVEMITIPGRNGAFALDNGRFQNIEVTYPAGIFADNELDFAQAVSDFRNFLCSKKGYCRLSDEYNPNEYRMAVYKSGLEVEPAQLRAGEFKITFECKPQRWLTSGETKQTIANSGDTITNPTLFDARPMVETTGYGTLTVNGHEIELENRPLGDVDCLEAQSATGTTASWTIDKSQILAGNTLTMNSCARTINGTTYQGSVAATVVFATVSGYRRGTYTPTLSNLEYCTDAGGGKVAFKTMLPSATFTEGTAGTVSGSGSVSVQINTSGGTLAETAVVSFAITLAYDGDATITVTISASVDTDAQNLLSYSGAINSISTSKVVGYSTVSTLGTPTYIDCDLGICYMIEGGNVIDLNKYIDLGSEMPYLQPGANTITFDNTFTKIEVVPRWWKV